ncbi:MAG TPA: hypothetical protein DDW52_05795 [Planctomycetaceae bacterium]|nr:hypothetical protein [Planctomycetaceae bacterium]
MGSHRRLVLQAGGKLGQRFDTAPGAGILEVEPEYNPGVAGPSFILRLIETVVCVSGELRRKVERRIDPSRRLRCRAFDY